MAIYAHAVLDEQRNALHQLGGRLAGAATGRLKSDVDVNPGEGTTQRNGGPFPLVTSVGRGGVEPPTFRFSGQTA